MSAVLFGGKTMESMLVSVWLVCAVLAALTLGVLLAYGLCLGMFSAFRIHARQVRERRAATAVVAPMPAAGNRA